jgi:hypothetical protein
VACASMAITVLRPRRVLWIAEPDDPTRLAPCFDPGDGSHPEDARALAHLSKVVNMLR